MNNLHLIEDEPKNVQQQVPINFGTMQPTSAVLADYLDVMEKRRSGVKTHLGTGIASLDAAIPGLCENGELVIVAGRPGMGKTSLGYQLLLSAAHQQKSAFFFSLEMSNVQIMERHLAAFADVPVLKLRNPGQLDEDEELRISVTMSEFGDLPLLVDQTPKSIDEIVSQTKFCSANLAADGRPPLGLILVDYLTIVAPSSSKSTNDLEIKEICRKLKALAKELRVPVVALAQLNRSLEQRQDKRPMMSDLRESGSIEQEADEILFIYRDEVYKPDSPEKGTAQIYTGKRRMLEMGSAKLKFDGPRMMFCDLDTPAKASAPAATKKGGSNDWNWHK